MSTEVRLRYPIQIQKGQRMSEPQNGRGALFAGGLTRHSCIDLLPGAASTGRPWASPVLGSAT